jgi:hypothetical protein
MQGMAAWGARSEATGPMLPGGRSQPCLWCWRSVSQRGVWSDGVGVDAPALGQHAQVFDRVEEFAVEELVAQLGVEAFPVAVLPGDQLRSDTGVDRQIIKNPVAWHSDHIQVGIIHIDFS